MNEPIYNKVNADRQNRDRNRRYEWRDIPERYENCGVTNHAAPIGQGGLNADAKKTEDADEEKKHS